MPRFVPFTYVQIFLFLFPGQEFNIELTGVRTADDSLQTLRSGHSPSLKAGRASYVSSHSNNCTFVGKARFRDEVLSHAAVSEQTKLPVKRLERKWRAKEMHKNKNSIYELTKLWKP